MELSNFYSGGYFIVRASRPNWSKPFGEYLPEGNLVSLSDCIAPHFAVHWGWSTGNKELAIKFGVPENKIQSFLDWCQSDYMNDMEYTAMFYSPNAARQAIQRFDIDTTDLYIIGAGLPKYLQPAWFEEENEYDQGVEERIKQGLLMEEPDTVLGYDVVSYQYNDFSHSWLCSHLEQDMHNIFGIRANQYGLLDSYEDAKTINDWIAEDDMKGKRAEPEPYDFWLIASYDI